MSNWRGYENPPLPPENLRYFDPYARSIDQPFPTPLDARGLVDKFATVKAVKSTIHSSYIWSSKVENHHFYFPSYDFPDQPGEEGNLKVFCNLPIFRGILPIDFEAWLHEVCEKPEVPDKEIRQYCIEAWDIAHNLFSPAKEIVKWARIKSYRRERLAFEAHMAGRSYKISEDVIAEEFMQNESLRLLRGIKQHQARNKEIPPEYRIIEIDTKVRGIVNQLGTVVSHRAFNLAPEVRAPEEDSLAA